MQSWWRADNWSTSKSPTRHWPNSVGMFYRARTKSLTCLFSKVEVTAASLHMVVLLWSGVAADGRPSWCRDWDLHLSPRTRRDLSGGGGGRTQSGCTGNGGCPRDPPAVGGPWQWAMAQVDPEYLSLSGAGPTAGRRRPRRPVAGPPPDRCPLSCGRGDEVFYCSLLTPSELDHCGQG